MIGKETLDWVNGTRLFYCDTSMKLECCPFLEVNVLFRPIRIKYFALMIYTSESRIGSDLLSCRAKQRLRCSIMLKFT